VPGTEVVVVVHGDVPFRVPLDAHLLKQAVAELGLFEYAPPNLVGAR
jgi:hypothetical protein